MYAVVRIGGKQHKVSCGDKITVEAMDLESGSELVLDEVIFLLKDVLVFGNPLVSDAKVKAKVLEHGRLSKIRIFKLKRRKHYQRRQGHRQYYTKLEILEISN